MKNNDFNNYGLELFPEKPQPKTINLRKYQNDAADAVIQSLKTPNFNPIVCAATGTGKSVIIAKIITRILNANHGARIMVAAHVAELLEQNADKLRSMMPSLDIGFYSAQLGKKNTHNQVIFAGIQSVFRELKIGKINVLIVDEAHTIGRKEKSMWSKLIDTLKESNPNLRVVGLSATPFRLDSGSLTEGEDSLFDEIVFDYGLGRAIQDGYLCPLTAKYTKTEFNIDGVSKIAGEYNLAQLEAATNLDHLTKQAVAEMVDLGRDRKSWLIFCNGVDHSFAIRDEIRRHGITCETVTGDTPDDERDRILQGIKDGSIRAVTNNAVWTTGIDIPNIDLIGMLRFTMSGGLLLQMAGRGTRIMIDVNDIESAKERREAILNSIKPNCLFLDFAKNIERHGFLDQIKAKEKGKKQEGVAPMKGCPECFSICHAAAPKCKDCGYEFPKNEKEGFSSAYKGSILGSEPEIRPVIAVEYSIHNQNKEGKTPCLMVRYTHPEGKPTKEYICLQHDGFAYQKAMKWWNLRDGPFIEGATVKFIVDNGMCDGLKTPESITVGMDGKWERILSHNGLKKPEFLPDRKSKSNNNYSIDDSADSEAFEIPW